MVNKQIFGYVFLISSTWISTEIMTVKPTIVQNPLEIGKTPNFHIKCSREMYRFYRRSRIIRKLLSRGLRL